VRPDLGTFELDLPGAADGVPDVDPPGAADGSDEPLAVGPDSPELADGVLPAPAEELHAASGLASRAITATVPGRCRRFIIAVLQISASGAVRWLTAVPARRLAPPGR